MTAQSSSLTSGSEIQRRFHCLAIDGPVYLGCPLLGVTSSQGIVTPSKKVMLGYVIMHFIIRCLSMFMA